MNRRVGILGGMGPEATVLMMHKVIATVPARDDSDHVPLIVDQNPQVPSRIKHLLEGTGEDPGPVLAAMAHRLVAAGAEALAMPCNSAHHYARAIRSAVDVPFLDMIALSADHAAELALGAGPVGLLASPAVRKVGLFDAALSRRGLSVLHAHQEADLLDAIRMIKAGTSIPAARQILKAASMELLSRGARVQLIACTEFSQIAESTAEGATSFDTLDLLVQAVVHFSRETPSEIEKGRDVCEPATKG